MLIGYTDEMTNQQLAELADWGDHHAKDVPNPTWKRAYALIREGADLLLRRRALAEQPAAPVKALRLNSAHTHTVLPDGTAPSCLICNPISR